MRRVWEGSYNFIVPMYRGFFICVNSYNSWSDNSHLEKMNGSKAGS